MLLGGMTSELLAETITEGGESVPCGATAEFCVCVKAAGHVTVGDEVHACDHSVCTAEWAGDIDGDDFRVVVYPMAVSS